MHYSTTIIIVQQTKRYGKNFIIFTYTELKENIEIIAFALPELMDLSSST